MNISELPAKVYSFHYHGNEIICYDNESASIDDKFFDRVDDAIDSLIAHLNSDY